MADRYWVGGSATWDNTAGTKWSTTSGGGGGASVPTASDNVFFTSASTYTVTLSGSPICLNFTVSAGTVTFSGTGGVTINGSLSLLSGTVWSATGTIIFDGATSKTITTNGVLISSDVYFGGAVGSTFQLVDALTVNTTKTTTLNLGTLDLNGKTLTTGRFDSNNTNVRTIAFGTGNIKVNATSPNSATLFTLTQVTNLTITGTPVVNISYSGGNTTTTVSPGALPESQAMSLYFSGNILALALVTQLNADAVKTLSFASVGPGSVIPTNTNGLIIYGDVTLPPLASGTALNGGPWKFNGTSGTQTLTSNGQPYGSKQVSVNGTSTLVLTDALTFATSGGLSVTSGGLDGGNKTITLPTGGVISLGTISTTPITIKNIPTTAGISQDAVVTIGGNCSCGLYNLNSGSLNLNGYTLTATSFLSGNTVTRTITFNGGTFAITGTSTQIWNVSVPSGFTTVAGTGTGKISFTNALSKTAVLGSLTYNCTISNDGAGLLTISGNNAISTVTSTSGSIAITGNNTITTITNAVQPMTYTFTAGTTQTITNWLVGGTAGNLVTIASATAASHTLSKASGIVGSNYLSISRSTATGGATWYAGANSTNGGNNSGWIFQNAPAAGGAFFAIF